VPDGKAVRVKITGAKPITIGPGTSVEITFQIAPRNMWPDISGFDAHRGDDATAGNPDPGDGWDDSAFADFPDSAFDTPAENPLDEWS